MGILGLGGSVLSLLLSALFTPLQRPVDWRKTHNLEVASSVLFGGLTEDYSPGDGLSESAEELFQRGKGGARIYGVLEEKVKACVWISKITANPPQNRYLKLVILALSWVWQDVRAWAYWKYSLYKHLNSLGPVSFFFSILSFSQSTQGGGMQGVIGCSGQWLDGISLLEWQAHSLSTDPVYWNRDGRCGSAESCMQLVTYTKHLLSKELLGRHPGFGLWQQLSKGTCILGLCLCGRWTGTRDNVTADREGNYLLSGEEN